MGSNLQRESLEERLQRLREGRGGASASQEGRESLQERLERLRSGQGEPEEGLGLLERGKSVLGGLWERAKTPVDPEEAQQTMQGYVEPAGPTHIAEENIAGGILSSVARFGGRMVQDVGTTARVAGDMLDPRALAEAVGFDPRAFTGGRQPAARGESALTRAGGAIEEAGRWVAEHPELRPSTAVSEAEQGGIAQMLTTPEWWIERGAEQIPLLGTQIALAMATSGASRGAQLAAFAAPIFGLEAGGQYRHLEEKFLEEGRDPQEAQNRAAAAAALTGDRKSVV